VTLRPLALLTRPSGEAPRTARELNARGWDALIAPVMEIRRLPDVPAEAGDATALIFTSAAGVRAWTEGRGRTDLPVWTVGEATAWAATASGFTHVVSSGGNAGDLVQYLIGTRKAEDGPILHVSGEHVAGDAAGELTRAGLTCRRLVLYRAELADRLPDSAFGALTAGVVRVAPFFSPRAAAAFVKLTTEAGALDRLRRVDALFLSDACARAGQAPWRAVRVATRPTEEALLATLPVDVHGSTINEDDDPA